ncbi:MAG TPA: hypothetical protein VL404_07210 [Candidatus Eisenbacteria bacterium]|jgi:hypothetical protein|nr:hypothetical protein [Candidatus Eisenbacteria bacterium]
MSFAHVDAKAIIAAVDAELERTRKSFLTTIEANELLDRLGLLKNNPKENGKNLRIVLRTGLVPHAYKLAGDVGQWVIPHSSTRRTLDKPFID